MHIKSVLIYRYAYVTKPQTILKTMRKTRTRYFDLEQNTGRSKLLSNSRTPCIYNEFNNDLKIWCKSMLSGIYFCVNQLLATTFVINMLLVNRLKPNFFSCILKLLMPLVNYVFWTDLWKFRRPNNVEITNKYIQFFLHLAMKPIRITVSWNTFSRWTSEETSKKHYKRWLVSLK